MAYDQKFTHVVRYDSPETEGLLNGVCYITPKLDGTNSVVWYDKEAGEIAAGSRNRRLSFKDDNAGFYKWVTGEDKEAKLLRDAAKKFPQFIFYGEWGVGKVAHIKDYNKEAKTALWLFDIYDIEKNEYLHPLEVKDMFEFLGLLEWSLPITVVENPTPESLLELAKKNYFLLDEASHPGEGIVIRRPDFRNKYGEYKIGKLVLAEYIQTQKVKKEIQPGEAEAEIVEVYLTEAELDKAKSKVLQLCEAEEFDMRSGKMIGMFINLAYHDSVLEDGVMAYVGKHKKAVIDFGLLQQLASKTCRLYLGLY